ncbi:hypothetical protein EU528_08950 [Candidatus Thorarchaeota archaeon]|nr:MAG: hypothetical protein EU528_08950 [Candidatus Thorarchaeota archaeon]
MAFDENDVYIERQGSSSKLFTEYSLSAILTLVGLLGSFMSVIGNASLVAILSLIWILTSLIDILTLLAMILSLIPIPLGILQVHQAYKLHKVTDHNYGTIKVVAIVILICSFGQALLYAFFTPILGLLILYALGGQIAFNAIVLYFLNQPEVRSEFE